jgi:hypothetical protein
MEVLREGQEEPRLEKGNGIMTVEMMYSNEGGRGHKLRNTDGFKKLEKSEPFLKKAGLLTPPF